MIANIYKVSCLTNLHVGNGDVNYSIIDNEVQRDPVTGMPTINSSGVKGAFREFFETNIEENNEDYKYIKKIFGSEQRNSTDQDNKDSGNESKNSKQMNSTPGNLKFLSASMLSRPMRASEGSEPFFNVTTKASLKLFFNLLEKFGISKMDKFIISEILDKIKALDESLYTSKENSKIEGNDTTALNDEIIDDFLKLILSENWAIMPCEDYKNIALPVLARNHLKDGKSENLWYEEIVPHQSVFYIPVLIDSSNESKDYLGKFNEFVNGKIVQFGGNASIGYGQTYIEKVGGNNE